MTTSRYDLYGPVHKGLRLAMADLLVLIGRTDFLDHPAADHAVAAVRAHLRLSRAHLHHEETHIHAALEARRPGATASLDEDHDHHRDAFADLEGRLADVVAAPGATSGNALYRALARFAAEDFAHMDREEGEITALLHAAFNDGELRAIEERIVASIDPELSMDIMALMLRAATEREQRAQLRAAQASAPPPVFAAILEAMAPHVPVVVTEFRRDLALAEPA